MSPRNFIIGLAVISLLQLAFSLLFIRFMAEAKAHMGFILISILALFLFCAMMYMAARVIANSRMTKLYIQLIMLAVFIKMLLCLALIVGYRQAFQPADQSFIWPFLFIYLTSTIYEVIFLEKVGRQKRSTQS